MATWTNCHTSQSNPGGKKNNNETVNHKEHGACAWTIWCQQLLWSGKGHIPVDPLDMYPGLAEVYGVYQSLQVLIWYINQYPLIPHQNARAAIYCNNLGVIERITNKTSDQQPRDMLRDDYPIFQEIDHILQHHHALRITFHHVDSHLDMQKPKQPLMIAEILNIEWDKRATQHSSNHQPLDQASNPMLKHSYPHLQIENKVIHHLAQHRLRDAATQAEYFMYLQEKFEWENQQIQDIHWPSVNRAMQQLDKPTRRIISKIIHKWLPLETRYHVCSESTQQYCPSCHTQAETADHFLQCTHPTCQQLWDELINRIQQLSIKNSITTWYRTNLYKASDP